MLRNVKLRNTAGSQRQNRLPLLHDLNIIQSLPARKTVADVFKIARHIFLSVHIIRLHVQLLGCSGGDGQHLFNLVCLTAQIRNRTCFVHDRGALHRQRMDCQILRRQLTNSRHRPLDLRRLFPGQTQDEIHINHRKANAAGGLKGFSDLLHPVLPADAVQRGLVHGLRVNRNSIDAVRLQHPQLLCRNRIRSAGFYRNLPEP